MCVCSRHTCGRQWETSQSLLFLPLHGLWNWVQVIRFSWREYLPASHLVDLCLYFYEVRILKVWEIYHAVLHFVFVDASFTCSATFFLSPLLAAVARTLREWTVHSIFFLLRVVVAKARFKLSTLNTLHSWDRLWTLGSVPPEGSGHVVARFPAPSRDCVRFVVRLQGVTDLKSLRSKSP